MQTRWRRRNQMCPQLVVVVIELEHLLYLPLVGRQIWHCDGRNVGPTGLNLLPVLRRYATQYEGVLAQTVASNNSYDDSRWSAHTSVSRGTEGARLFLNPNCEEVCSLQVCCSEWLFVNKPKL